MGRIVSAVVMASGFSKRMGQDKLLMPLQKNNQNLTLLQWTLQALKQSSIDRLLVVYREEAVSKVIENESIQTCFNAFAEEGQSASIRVGIQDVVKRWPETEGILFVPGDMAVLTSEVIDRLVETFRCQKQPAIVYPLVDNEQKAPVLFDQVFFEALLLLEGDQGGRSLLKKTSPCGIPVVFENSAPFEDIDSIGDFQKVMAWIETVK